MHENFENFCVIHAIIHSVYFFHINMKGVKSIYTPNEIIMSYILFLNLNLLRLWVKKLTLIFSGT